MHRLSLVVLLIAAVALPSVVIGRHRHHNIDEEKVPECIDAASTQCKEVFASDVCDDETVCHCVRRVKVCQAAYNTKTMEQAFNKCMEQNVCQIAAELKLKAKLKSRGFHLP